MSESSITRLRSNCTTLEVDLKSYQVRHAALSDSIFQLKEENVALENRKNELDAALENANERLGTADADIADAQTRSEELRAQYRNKQTEIQQMDRQLASKSARLGLLNDFQSRMEGFSEGVKSIMKGRLSECIKPDDVKIVSQNVEVENGWTSAFETMLGTALDAVVLEDSSKLAQTLSLLRERSLGNACFQISDANFEESQTAMPQGIFRGADIVRTEREELKAFTANLVCGCYFCEDIASFASFAAQNKNFRFVTAVARDGSMLDARGNRLRFERGKARHGKQFYPSQPGNQTPERGNRKRQFRPHGAHRKRDGNQLPPRRRRTRNRKPQKYFRRNQARNRLHKRAIFGSPSLD